MSFSDNKIRVVLFGCQTIAVNFIKLLNSIGNIELKLVVTNELPLDKTYNYESVVDECEKLGVKVINPAKLSNRYISEIESISPHIIFSIYYRKILPQRLLDLPTMGSINIHPSLLPEYRGPIPTAWAIQNGEKYFGITIHMMDRGIDTGDILVQERFEIGPDETGYELYQRGMELGFDLLRRNLGALLKNELVPYRQVGIGSYFGKKTGLAVINWQQKTEEIRNLIRVHSRPYNPARATLMNRYVLISRAKAVYEEKYPSQGVGIIVDIIDNKPVVSCADGCLLLEDYMIFPELNENERGHFIKVGNRFA